MNFKVRLDEVADKAGLPAKLGLDLLKIAVFLDRALEMSHLAARDSERLTVSWRPLGRRMATLSKGSLASLRKHKLRWPELIKRPTRQES